MQRDGGPGGGGPAGGGNPTGSSFTGPAETLELVGDFAYAYSGIIETQTSDTTYLDFTTGNYISIGKLEFFYAETPVADGGHILYTVKMAETIIAQFTDRRDIRSSPTYRPMNIIIPAYTPILVICKAISATSDQAITFTGRIYRG